ncbi:hypothetical protein ACFPOI_51015 [Nonomuraea angiospora]|uniref:Site-specific recombinase XerC n=1 Tax=Nonomuraea angiospora TaxID=46172 RepID=A0ABR9M264_9ACTN|nr:hypothetical protein [Nonomuraea angiospora]MBE1586690.1 site-specific recombinase XerC [Nonomuraea angiospora]
MTQQRVHADGQVVVAPPKSVATLALAARTDLKVVQAMLGHASIVLTADTYVSVLPEVAHEAARETARLVLKAASALGRPLGG